MATDKYRKAHPHCEACKLARNTAEVHHIKTRGAGGPDDDWNLLALCVEHHQMIHAMGRRTFAEMNPAVKDKILKVITGLGK